MAEEHDDEMERLLFSGSHLQHVNKSHHDIEANALIRKPEPEQDDRSLAAEEAANQEEKAAHERNEEKAEREAEQLTEQLEEEIAAKEEEQAATREQEHEETELANDNEAIELSDNEQEEASLDLNDSAEELGKEYEEFLENDPDLDPDFELQPEDLETTPEEAPSPESLSSDTEPSEHAVETHSVETQSVEAETAQLDVGAGGGGHPPQQPPSPMNDFPEDNPEPDIAETAAPETLDESANTPSNEPKDYSTQDQISDALGGGVLDMATAQIVGRVIDDIADAYEKSVNEPDTYLDWGEDDKDTSIEPEIVEPLDDIEQPDETTSQIEQPDSIEQEAETESALEWNSGDEQQQEFEPDPDSSQADTSNLDWNDGAEQDHSTDMQQSQEQEAAPPQIEWNNGSDSPEPER